MANVARRCLRIGRRVLLGARRFDSFTADTVLWLNKVRAELEERHESVSRRALIFCQRLHCMGLLAPSSMACEDRRSRRSPNSVCIPVNQSTRYAAGQGVGVEISRRQCTRRALCYFCVFEVQTFGGSHSPYNDTLAQSRL